MLRDCTLAIRSRLIIIIICRLARAIRHLWQGVWPLSNARGPFAYARIMAAHLTSLEIAHWPFDCAKRLHVGDSNLESPISNLLGHRAKRLHVGDSNLESRISNLLGHRAIRRDCTLAIRTSNLQSPIS